MLKKHFPLFVFIILCLAVFLRVYNYPNHWGLAIDQAHDALVARHMVSTGSVPLLGVFSSAGPWQGSGVWYWFIALGTVFNPSLVITPWVFLTAFYMVFVFLIMMVGRELVDKRFALIVGLLTAVSPAQIAHSVNLTNQGPLAMTSLLALWSAVRFLRTRRWFYSLFMGFFAALGASIHLQGAAMAFFVILVLLFTMRHMKIVYPIAVFCGAVLALSPWLIGDAREGFMNIKNMFYYATVDQYNIPLEALGRRWLTYIRDFWPAEWGRIAGGSILFGWGLSVPVFAWAAWLTIRKKALREIIVIIISFLIMAGYMKNTRTPLFSSYLVFLHPFVLLISAWGLWELMRRYFRLGMLAVFLVVVFAGRLSFLEAANSTNQTYARARSFSYKLYDRYPGQAFALFDYKYETALDSLALSLILDAEGRSDEKGLKLGFGRPPSSVIPDNSKQILVDGVSLLEFGSTQSAALRRNGWIWVYPKGVYTEAIEWKE